MRHPFRALPRKYRLWVLLVCGTALYFFANLQRVAVPGSIFNSLQGELDLSAPQVTAFGSIFMYVYALDQLVIGLLVDRYGGFRVIAAGGLVFCVGSAAFALSDSLMMLYCSRAVTALGASCLYLSLVREIIRAFDRNLPVILGLVVLTGYVGGIAANAPFVLSAEAIGWRHTLLVAAGISSVFYLLFLAIKPTLKMPTPRRKPLSFRPFAELLRKRHNRHLYMFYSVNFGLYYVMQTMIGKKFLEDFCRLPSTSSAWVLSGMGAISAAAGFGFAMLSRLLGNRRRVFARLAGGMCLGVFLAITGLVLGDVRSDWIVVLLCLLALTGSTVSVMVPLLRETNRPEVAGSSISLMNSFAFMSVAIFGNAAGYLMDTARPKPQGDVLVYPDSSYLAVFTVFFLASCEVAWCAFQLRETWGKNESETI